MPRLILGIDDAGRGPVIGPMVLAGCLIDKGIEPGLRKLGVRDSKQLTPKRREFLAEIIKEKAEAFETVLLSPEKIDTSKEEGIKLNELEALAAAKIINKLNTGKEKIKVVLDCPSTSIVKWSDYLRMHVDNLKNLEIVCEHKADRNHIAVSAASILAKSQREKAMEKLRGEYGEDFGSGYPSDPKTKGFLSKNANKHKGLFRKSWKTWQKANSDTKQKKLF
jgi:ribonuclease HII